MGNELGINEKVLKIRNLTLGPEKFNLHGRVLPEPVNIDFVLAEKVVEETQGQKMMYIIYLETPPSYPNPGIYVERYVIDSFPCDSTDMDEVKTLYNIYLDDLVNSDYKWGARLYLRLD